MKLDDEEWMAISDRLEGWELVEFLQVSITDILIAATEYDWLDNEKLEEVLELIGLIEKKDNGESNYADNYD